MEIALFEIGEELALLAGTEWNDAWVGMFGDVLLRRLVLHFLLCRAALALHKKYGRIQSYQPTCFPPFPKVRFPLGHLLYIVITKHVIYCGIRSNSLGQSGHPWPQYIKDPSSVRDDNFNP